MTFPNLSDTIIQQVLSRLLIRLVQEDARKNHHKFLTDRSLLFPINILTYVSPDRMDPGQIHQRNR
jgi:hypothetical protein